MKFTCHSCGKRYSSTDEPAPGKIYRIRCKCGSALVVKGPEATPAAAPPAPIAAEPVDPALRHAAATPLSSLLSAVAPSRAAALAAPLPPRRSSTAPPPPSDRFAPLDGDAEPYGAAACADADPFAAAADLADPFAPPAPWLAPPGGELPEGPTPYDGSGRDVAPEPSSGRATPGPSGRAPPLDDVAIDLSTGRTPARPAERAPGSQRKIAVAGVAAMSALAGAIVAVLVLRSSGAAPGAPAPRPPAAMTSPAPDAPRLASLATAAARGGDDAARHPDAPRPEDPVRRTAAAGAREPRAHAGAEAPRRATEQREPGPGAALQRAPATREPPRVEAERRVEVADVAPAPEPTPAPKPPPRSAVPPEVVSAAMARSRAELDACMRDASEDPDEKSLLGRHVALTVQINPDGHVTRPTLDDPEVAEAILGYCLKRVVVRLAFPAFQGSPVQVQIPIVLAEP